MTDYKLAIWNQFCDRHSILSNGVQLFGQTSGLVNLMPYGQNGRIVLCRSEAMDALVRQEATRVVNDYNEGSNDYDGLIYMMYRPEGEQVIPLYIGKTEKYGKKGNLSNNITTKAYFCRWGYNYAYHMGDLSACVCNRHPESKKTLKYQKWANALFEKYPNDSPRLRSPVYFWTKAWCNRETGIWPEFGKTSLTFLEYLMIGVASSLYPEDLLNTEGVNRMGGTQLRVGR